MTRARDTADIDRRMAAISTAEGNLTLAAGGNGTGWWTNDPVDPRFIEDQGRAFFGLAAIEAADQFTGTNWVSTNFNHYLIRSNTLTSLSKYGGTAAFSATRNGDRYRQPALDAALAIWQGGEVITAGALRGRIGKRYLAATSGTCGGTPPTHSSGTVSDGGVDWTYVSNRGQYFTPIAHSALAWAELDDGEGTWGSYIDVTRGASGGLLFGVEYAVKNLGTNVVADPFNVLPAGGTIGVWMAGGGDPSYGGVPGNPSTVAFLVGKNGNSWNTGLLFEDDGLATIDGRGRAIALGPTHAVQWFRAAGLPCFEVRADGGVAGRDMRVVSNGYTTEFRAVRPNGVEETLFGIAQPDMSAANSRANQFYFDVSVSTTGGAGNGWVKMQAAGFDTNVDLILEPKGIGAIKIPGRVDIVADTSPLDYSTSRAKFVYQQRDTAAGATNELIPGAVFQFNATGNGTVNAGIELSQTIWQGQFNYMSKTGDGSAHTFTAIGELKAVGPGGYNELGLFQGEGTNIASALGTMSGVEMLLKDSPDAGATTFSTKMQAVVGRIAKYNPTVRKSHNFYASCEGTQAIDAILGGNPGGLASWLRGFDFQGLTFTTGQFGLAPNNTYLAWLRAGGVAAPIIGLNDADDVFIAASTPTNRVNIGTSALATRLAVDQDATNAVLLWLNGALKRVTVGAADSGGAGFRQLIVPN